MMPKFALAALLALAVCAPFETASAQDPLAGAIVGGAAGAIVGGAIGGGGGAAVGARAGAGRGAPAATIAGEGTEAAVTAHGEARRGGYYYYDRGCYLQRP